MTHSYCGLTVACLCEIIMMILCMALMPVACVYAGVTSRSLTLFLPCLSRFSALSSFEWVFWPQQGRKRSSIPLKAFSHGAQTTYLPQMKQRNHVSALALHWASKPSPTRQYGFSYSEKQQLAMTQVTETSRTWTYAMSLSNFGSELFVFKPITIIACAWNDALRGSR